MTWSFTPVFVLMLGGDPGTQPPIVDPSWVPSWQFSYHPVTPHVRTIRVNSITHDAVSQYHRPYFTDIDRCVLTLSLHDAVSQYHRPYFTDIDRCVLEQLLCAAV